MLLALVAPSPDGAELRELGQRASAAEPGQRPASAAGVQQALARFLAREPFGSPQLAALWRQLAAPRTEREEGASTTGVLEAVPEAPPQSASSPSRRIKR
jgi:hypothetical protein